MKNYWISTKTPPPESGSYFVVCKYADTAMYLKDKNTWTISDFDGDPLVWEGIEWWFPYPEIPVNTPHK